MVERQLAARGESTLKQERIACRVLTNLGGDCISKKQSNFQKTRNHEIFDGLSFIEGVRHQFGQNHLIS